jgi:hypothetical protein
MRWPFILALALLIASCSKGRAIYQSPNAIAALQAAGYTHVDIIRPGFSCAPDRVVPYSSSIGGGSLQHGRFFDSLDPAGQKVRGIVCFGYNLPARILVIGPDVRGFSPQDNGGQ